MSIWVVLLNEGKKSSFQDLLIINTVHDPGKNMDPSGSSSVYICPNMYLQCLQKHKINIHMVNMHINLRDMALIICKQSSGHFEC